ncbi:hypothetical protein [Riemerella anatipestifer]|nr:hypothetical protein [Riemerella anatipestifer]AGC40103.1 hypothetical protein G148_0799 [Riemerella anatipestifer RA-CH-2]AKP69213.1 hypothetical protein CG08_0916 [Riemerella anatipestifer]AKP71093.1 hypothetical protein CG09_0876 [Riemerella anatipestifer]MBT0530669.1 hypothetical protein [Riemerella anatipestifer]MBT0572936.1 hypothetical protein [Riemerella anatipestifer]
MITQRLNKILSTKIENESLKMKRNMDRLFNLLDSNYISFPQSSIIL